MTRRRLIVGLIVAVPVLVGLWLATPRSNVRLRLLPPDEWSLTLTEYPRVDFTGWSCQYTTVGPIGVVRMYGLYPR
jgi:hypothetical protein